MRIALNLVFVAGLLLLAAPFVLGATPPPLPEPGIDANPLVVLFDSLFYVLRTGEAAGWLATMTVVANRIVWFTRSKRVAAWLERNDAKWLRAFLAIIAGALLGFTSAKVAGAGWWAATLAGVVSGGGAIALDQLADACRDAWAWYKGWRARRAALALLDVAAEASDDPKLEERGAAAVDRLRRAAGDARSDTSSGGR